ncbi:MAG: ATP-binding cassette domain-containing protein [Desulfovibrionaceae bacterium]|nr:ATP-binding cassette domain-containing protein [Desulfovibrionaceae bacterium]
MTTPILEISNLYFKYTEATVLEDISLTLYKGDRLVIIGPNGGGKSTLLYCIAGVCKPTQGSILYNGIMYPHHISHIGYVPQYPTHNSTMLISVLDVVLLGKISLFTSSVTKKSQKDYARHLLTLVGLENKERVLFSSLSGGEKQRVLLARALLAQPDLLLLDEPTASVDPKSRFCFYELLARLDTSISIIMTTHDINAIDTSFTSLAVVDRTIERYDSISMSQEILHKLYGKHHNHLCGISTFVEKILPHGN